MEDDNFKRKFAKHLYTTDAKIEQLIRNEEDILRKFRRLSMEAGMEYTDIENVFQIISKGEEKADKAKAQLVMRRKALDLLFPSLKYHQPWATVP